MFQQKDIYYFDSENLSYSLKRFSAKIILLKVILFIIIGILFGVTGFIISSAIYDTPADRKLQNENYELRSNYESLNQRAEQLSRNLNALIFMDDSIYRTVLGVNPYPHSIREAGKGGSDIYSKYNNSEIVWSTAKKLDKLLDQTTVQKSSYDKVLASALKNKKRMLHLPAIMPVHIKDLSYIGSGFGRRFHPILHYWRPHEGMDFIAPKGTKVYATAYGKVVETRYSSTFGNVIKIDHGFGYLTLYGHLSKFNVKKGQNVKRGEVIGYVGSTGLSSGSHLHYEVHLNGEEVDPVNYYFHDLSPKEYDKIIELSKTNLYSMD